MDSNVKNDSSLAEVKGKSPSPRKTTTKTTSQNEILGEFGLNLQKLIEDAVGKKTKELEEKEALICERESKVDKILKSQHAEGIIRIQVGNEVFCTTAGILLSVDDSYFHGMLNPKLSFKLENGSYFIARDADSFRYVIEYLTYGDLMSDIEDTGLLRKLIADADFYLLPGLKEAVSKKMKKNQGVVAKFSSTTNVSNGNFWNWDIPKISNPELFEVNGCKIIFLKSGLFLIMLRVIAGNNQNGNCVVLKINGIDVARSFHCDYQCYQNNTWQLNEVFDIKEKDQLSVYHTFNGSSNTDQLGNMLTIIML